MKLPNVIIIGSVTLYRSRSTRGLTRVWVCSRNWNYLTRVSGGWTFEGGPLGMKVAPPRGDRHPTPAAAYEANIERLLQRVEERAERDRGLLKRALDEVQA